ncbi:hypothetical protein [Oceanithermus sp.]|uniref:hypothetical protein n=1 Tax=Oceanithermus sp. TaxID=2268145 RepID=UPI00257F8D81|nr:hypothetical protein [Oceanithermus sp.]
MNGKLHPAWITDEHGNRVSVVLPVEEYEALLEDLADLAAVAERRDEPTVTHEELVRRLRADGLL